MIPGGWVFLTYEVPLYCRKHVVVPLSAAAAAAPVHEQREAALVHHENESLYVDSSWTTVGQARTRIKVNYGRAYFYYTVSLG